MWFAITLVLFFFILLAAALIAPINAAFQTKVYSSVTNVNSISKIIILLTVQSYLQ